MNETYVTVTGNLTADPLQRLTRNGDTFATIRVASTERRRCADGSYENGSTSYYAVVCYGVLGRNVLGSLRKGMPVVVHGRQRISEWTSGERRGVAVDIQASAVGPDLSRCHATVHRGPAPLRGNDRLAEQEIQEALAELDGRFVDGPTGDSDLDGLDDGLGGDLVEELVDTATGEVIVRSATGTTPSAGAHDGADEGAGGAASERDEAGTDVAV